MAKEVAISKRIKISKAQEYMVLAVLGASVILGIAAALLMHFVKLISFNANVIGEEDKSISAYSNVIKSVGICKSPKGANYSLEELKQCDPASIEISEIPDTLRANILQNLAANDSLNSVTRSKDSNCLNPATGKAFTYDEMIDAYSDARGAEELQMASALIKSCSALRVIPDALPNFRNEEALLASLNKIYLVSNWEPESIASSGEDSGLYSVGDDGSGAEPTLNLIVVESEIEADSSAVTRVLNNMERSIREFDLQSVKIEWEADALEVHLRALAYYVNESSVKETDITVSPEEK